MNQDELKIFEKSFFKKEDSKINESKILTVPEINEKYLKGEVRIVTEQARYPLNTISEMFSGSDYILNPEFQRRHRWNIEKQSKLIESFIINVPIPPIFLYEKDYSVYEVMDGLQRISAIKDFYENKYKLKGLELWPELNGMSYSELPEQIKKGIDRRYISSIVLLKETAKSEEEAKQIKQMVFARINSGGAKLEDQELRNAQYPSAFNDMIINLARNDHFCEIFDIPRRTDDENIQEDNISDELKENAHFSTMKDVEIVLRFFAMRNLDIWGDTTLSKFFNYFASLAQGLSDEVLSTYKTLFEDTMKLAYELFGDKAFCMFKMNKNTEQYRWTKKPTMVIYDSLVTVLSRHLNESSYLIGQKDNVVAQLEQLFRENDSLLNGRNTSKSDVSQRISIFDEFFTEMLQK